MQKTIDDYNANTSEGITKLELIGEVEEQLELYEHRNKNNKEVLKTLQPIRNYLLRLGLPGDISNINSDVLKEMSNDLFNKVKQNGFN